MLREFTKLWFNARPGIKKRLEEIDIEYMSGYEEILRIMLEEFNKVIDKSDIKYDGTEFNLDVRKVDYGHYQGTLILTFARDDYQPDAVDTFYTYVQYGSCSVCDTFLHIQNANPYIYDDYENLSEEEKEQYCKAKEQQIEDLLTLCLHMVEHIRCFDDINYNND